MTVDAAPRPGHPEPMRIAGSLLPLVLAFVTCTLVAQDPPKRTVTLPHGAGMLEVPTGWTVLGAAELAAETRESDPAEDPARLLITSLVQQLQQDQRTNDNVLMHGPGATAGQARTISAYSAERPTTSEELQRPETLAQIRRAFEEGMAPPGVSVAFLGEDQPDVFAIGSISITFRWTVPVGTLHKQIYIVPAGQRLQYFETDFWPDDLDAPTAIANILRTFDGAGETEGSDTLTKMLIGGAAGAMAGIMVALMRRRKQQRRQIGVD